GLFETLIDLGAQLAGAVLPVLGELAPILGEIGAVLAGALGEALETIVPVLVEQMPTIGEALVAIAEAFAEIFSAAAPAIPLLAEVAAILMTQIGVPVIVAIAEGLGVIAQAISAMGPVFPAVIAGVIGFKVAMAALGVVLAVNPIVLLAAAIAALVVGLV